MSKLKVAFPSVHWEVTKSKAAEAYVMKEDTRLDGPWVIGKAPVKRQSGTDWKKIKEQAQAG